MKNRIPLTGLFLLTLVITTYSFAACLLEEGSVSAGQVRVSLEVSGQVSLIDNVDFVNVQRSLTTTATIFTMHDNRTDELDMVEFCIGKNTMIRVNQGELSCGSADTNCLPILMEKINSVKQPLVVRRIQKIGNVPSMKCSLMKDGLSCTETSPGWSACYWTVSGQLCCPDDGIPGLKCTSDFPPINKK